MVDASKAADPAAHRFCISVGQQQMEYRRSRDYELCNSDGSPNLVGRFVRRPSGEIMEIKPICDLATLPDGSPNPAWDGCPMMGVVKPDNSVERLDKLLKEMK